MKRKEIRGTLDSGTKPDKYQMPIGEYQCLDAL